MTVGDEETNITNVIMVADGARLQNAALLSMALSTHFCDGMFDFFVGIPAGGDISFIPDDFGDMRITTFIIPADEYLVDGRSYRIINKVRAMMHAPCYTGILVDTDTFFLTSFPKRYVLREVATAVPEHNPFPGFVDGFWLELFERFGLVAPKFVVRYGSGKFGFPYFNAGLIASTNLQEFGAIWMDVCNKINQLNVARKNPYLDQIALPIAMAIAGSGNLDERNVLPEEFNRNLFHWDPVSNTNIQRTIMMHHHDRVSLVRAILGRKFDGVIERFPVINQILPQMAYREYEKYTSAVSSQNQRKNH